MKPDSRRARRVFHGVFILVGFISGLTLLADQIQMRNGDFYVGKVTALNSNSVVLQSEVLGNVQLPRAKVMSVTLGTNQPSVVANASSPASVSSNASVAAVTVPTEIPASLQKLAAHSNLVQQVQSRFLADAGPEANAKFSELMAGLTSGKTSMNDLRAEAKSLASQARELRRGLDDDAGASLDMYLSVLDKFLDETPANETKARGVK